MLDGKSSTLELWVLQERDNAIRPTCTQLETPERFFLKVNWSKKCRFGTYMLRYNRVMKIHPYKCKTVRFIIIENPYFTL